MNGLIAFIDILGYQSFLRNNVATESALRVLDIITSLPGTVQADFNKRWSETKFPANIPERLKHVIFSDTIVVTMSYSDEKERRAAFLYMTVFASELVAKMFSEGLPVRGVLHEGDFVVKDTCFAGGGIVDAYQLCSRLDFSGLVCSPTLAKTALGWQQETKPYIQEDSFSDSFVSFLSSTKEGEERLLHVNWLRGFKGGPPDDIRKDVDRFVLSSFWGHKKDCPASADSKVHNTTKLIRRLLITVDEMQKRRLSNSPAKKKS